MTASFLMTPPTYKLDSTRVLSGVQTACAWHLHPWTHFLLTSFSAMNPGKGISGASWGKGGAGSLMEVGTSVLPSLLGPRLTTLAKEPISDIDGSIRSGGAALLLAWCDHADRGKVVGVEANDDVTSDMSATLLSALGMPPWAT